MDILLLQQIFLLSLNLFNSLTQFIQLILRFLLGPQFSIENTDGRLKSFEFDFQLHNLVLVSLAESGLSFVQAAESSEVFGDLTLDILGLDNAIVDVGLVVRFFGLLLFLAFLALHTLGVNLRFILLIRALWRLFGTFLCVCLALGDAIHRFLHFEIEDVPWRSVVDALVLQWSRPSLILGLLSNYERRVSSKW